MLYSLENAFLYELSAIYIVQPLYLIWPPASFMSLYGSVGISLTGTISPLVFRTPPDIEILDGSLHPNGLSSTPFRRQKSFKILLDPEPQILVLVQSILCNKKYFLLWAFSSLLFGPFSLSRGFSCTDVFFWKLSSRFKFRRSSILFNLLNCSPKLKALRTSPAPTRYLC